MTVTVYYSVGNNPNEYSVEVEAKNQLDALQQVDFILRLNGESYSISLRPFKDDEI